MTEPLQVSLEEAARLFGYSERTVQRMVSNGDIVATGSGRLRRYDMQSIIDKQARMRQGEPPLCVRRKAAPTVKVFRATQTDAGASSGASKLEIIPDATKPKLSLIPRMPNRGAGSK